MLRWTALASILAFCAIDAAYCDETETNQSLPAAQRLASFEIVMGRVTIAQARCGQCRRQCGESLSQGHGEYLAVNARGKEITLRYESISDERRLTIDFPAADEVEIVAEHVGGANPYTVRFQQPRRGKLRLSIERESVAAELTAAGFWQLMLAYPAECRQYLVPLLERLRPDWRLDWQAQQVETELLYAAPTLNAGQREQLAALVEQLGAEDFAVRQTAFRSLHQQGQPALVHLQRIAPQSLSAEQRYRVRQLIDKLSIDERDTAQRVALRLGEQPSVWIALMSHSDSAVRQQAADRLAQICGDRIEFDAAAARERRESQLADVRQQFETE